MKRTNQQNREEWRPVIGYEGFYEVSSYGRVKSLERGEFISEDSRSYWRRRQSRILKNQKNSIGYMQVNIGKQGEGSKTLSVHRMVAEAFLLNEKGRPFVNHKDGNPQNNRLENLEWCTNSENIRHAYRELMVVPWTTGKFGADSPKSVAVNQFTPQGVLVKTWLCASDAVRERGFDSAGITKCCKGRQMLHKGYRWCYA